VNENQFMTLLRNNGYEHTGVTGCYIHKETGVTFNMFDWHHEHGEKWRYCIENGLVPDGKKIEFRQE